MTTEHDNKRVSDAYRELARETTSAGLDERVLAMATRGSQSRYGLARAWIRPVAWAAMIGISLALVLELTWFIDVPLENGVPQPPISAERTRQDAEVMKATHPDSLRQSIGEPEEAPAVMAPASMSPGATKPPAAGDELKPALVIEDASLPENAAKRALLPATSERREAGSASSDKTETERFCESDALTSADDWYECILELREQGLVDEASAELEALFRAFPDFREPAPE
jgi:hypothetical protein